MELEKYFTNKPIWSFAKVVAIVALMCWIYAHYVWAWMLPGHTEGYQMRAVYMLTAIACLFAGVCFRQLYRHFKLMSTTPIHLCLTCKNQLVVKEGDLHEVPIDNVFPGYPSWQDFLLDHPALLVKRGWFSFEIFVLGQNGLWNVRYLGYRPLYGYGVKIHESGAGDSIVLRDWQHDRLFRNALRAMSGGGHVTYLTAVADNAMQSKRVWQLRAAKNLTKRMLARMRNKG